MRVTLASVAAIGFVLRSANVVVAAPPAPSQQLTPCRAPPFVSPGRSDASDTYAELLGQAYSELEANFKPGQPNKWSSCTKNTCTLEEAKQNVRVDWETLNDSQKLDYIDAIKCMFAKDGISPPGFAAAARNRYDDFVAIHVNLTLKIHGTYNFLAWHRYFIWQFEQTIRQECGFKGNLPYWNWFTYVGDIHKHPVFDGSNTSLSGDGAFYQHNGSVSDIEQIYIPSGQGGGCLLDGPFKDLEIHIGPIRPAMRGLKSVASNQVYNPRCISRDLSDFIPTHYFNKDNLVNLTTGDASASVLTFQNELQGRVGFLGIHAGGHYTMGGDASCVFSSVNDPAFWLHHTMLDSVWWIWQQLNPDRADEVMGMTDFIPNNTTRPGTLDDVQSLGVNGKAMKIKYLLDTMGGSPFCYYYA